MDAHIHLYTESEFRRLNPNLHLRPTGIVYEMYGERVTRLRCGLIDYVVRVEDVK